MRSGLELGDLAGVQACVSRGDGVEEKYRGWTPLMKAAEEGFVTLTGETVTDQIRQALAQFVAAANAEDPTQLLAPGFENWVSLSVLAQVRKAGFGITEVQEQGTQLIRDFMRADRTKALLEQLGLKSQLVNMSECHRFVANRNAGRQDDGQKDASARLAGIGASGGIA